MKTIWWADECNKDYTYELFSNIVSSGKGCSFPDNDYDDGEGSDCFICEQLYAMKRGQK